MYQNTYKGTKVVLRKKAAPKLVAPKEKASYTQFSGCKEVRMDSAEFTQWINSL